MPTDCRVVLQFKAECFRTRERHYSMTYEYEYVYVYLLSVCLLYGGNDIMMVASRPVRLQATPIPHLTDAILRRQLVYQTAEAEASRVQTPHGCLCPRDKHQNDDRAANRTRVASATTRSTNLYTTQSLLFITRRHCQFMLLPSDTSVVCHLCAPKKMCYRG